MQGDSKPSSKDAAPQASERGVIRGVVKSPWGTVGGATVTVAGKPATADVAGKYEMPSLDPGTYEVTAQAPFPGYEAVPQKIEIAAGETKDVDVYLDFKKTVVEGYVYELNGKPIAGAALSGVLYGSDMQTAKTDERGYFRFDKVTPGGRFMRVNASGFMGETRDFTAKEETATRVEFRLTPATCKIHGTVTDENGKPLQVELHLLRSGIVVQKANSDANSGYYEFPVLQGIYEILPIPRPGYSPKGWHGSVTADTKADFAFVPAPEMPKGQLFPPAEHG